MRFSSTLRLSALPSKIILTLLGCGLLIFSSPAALAQSSSGIISGRVYNPVSGDYVRNAKISVDGGPSVVSEDGGFYRIVGVTPGQVTLRIAYTGYGAESATVNVRAGQTAVHDWQLISSMQGANEDGVVEMQSFVVSSEREGNAKAIMDQRNSMNITNTVASDVFGDVAEGNVGEFLKHLPGVDGDITDGTMRYIRLRGLPSEYTSVTIDGVSLASADANVGSSNNARAFTFEQVSLSSMDSIEVSKTVSADVDANAPAGTINLKTKRAFDRKGRRVTAQANITATSWDLSPSSSIGPDEKKHRKILPGGIFEYSDVYMDGRLGVILNVSESNFYSVRTPTNMSYNYTTTPTDTRPVVLTNVRAVVNARTSERFTTTLTADFKATENLVLGLGVVYNTSDLWSYQRVATFQTGGRSGLLSTSDDLNNISTTLSGRIDVQPLGIAKLGETQTFLPKFEYKKNNLTIEGRFSSSTSESTYDPLGHRGSFFSPGTMMLNGVSFDATRSAAYKADWKFRQTGGPDFSDGTGYTMPSVFIDDGRFAKMKVFNSAISARLETNKGVPIVWKTGVKSLNEKRNFELERNSFKYDYVGANAGTGAWAGYASDFEWDFGPQDMTFQSTTGGNRPFSPNLQDMAAFYQENPSQFVHSMSATDYYNAYIANKKDYQEDILAAYFMGTAKLGNKTTFRAGLRWEQTETDSLEFDALSSDEVLAAGYPVSNGRATTIPGVEHQYLSRPKIHRTGKYDNLFPSSSLKYEIRENLHLQLGYSKTIRRPSFNNVAGVWTINDDTLRVNAPNPGLEPEVSDNFSTRIAYYFEPVGIFAVNFFQNTVNGKHVTNEQTAQEFGYTGDLPLDDYIFVTKSTAEGETIVKGMELEYSQSLSFLPYPFNGLNARASYTRNYAQITIPNMAPHLVTGGLSYSFGRGSISANVNWGSDAPTNTAGTVFQRHRVNLDAAATFRFNQRWSTFLNVRNVLNTPHILVRKIGDLPAHSSQYQVFGTTFTLGVKAAF